MKRRRVRRPSQTVGRRSGPPTSDVEAFEQWLDRVAAVRFDRQAVYAAGNWIALYDALQDAIEAARDGANGDDLQVTLPAWAVRGLGNAIMAPPAPHAKRPRGRPRKTWSAAQWRQDMIDWKRFRQVWYRRIARREGELPHPGPKAQRQIRSDWAKAREANATGGVLVDVWTPYPWTPGAAADDWSVFEAVARVFGSSIYGGSAAQIRKSYEAVTRALRNGEAWRYYPSKWIPYDEHQLRSADVDSPR